MINIVSNIRCDLGEGIVWDPALQSLLMVDIIKQHLIAINLNDGAVRKWEMPETVSWVLTTDMRGVYMLGLKSGLALFHSENQSKLVWVNKEFPGRDDCRLNDACTDFLGRVWYGSMGINEQKNPRGQLASFSKEDGLKIHDSGFGVSNGPIISPDGEHLFFSNTLEGTIYRYKFSIKNGTVSNREIFKQFGSNDGLPDGMCFDHEGNLWLAMWGGGCVLKCSQNGNVLDQFFVPALNVTNVCFGGDGLDRLFVTSALSGVTNELMDSYPYSGCIFEVLNHQVMGMPSSPVRLESI